MRFAEGLSTSARACGRAGRVRVRVGTHGRGLQRDAPSPPPSKWRQINGPVCSAIWRSAAAPAACTMTPWTAVPGPKCPAVFIAGAAAVRTLPVLTPPAPRDAPLHLPVTCAQLMMWSLKTNEWLNAALTCDPPKVHNDAEKFVLTVDVCHLTQFAVYYSTSSETPGTGTICVPPTFVSSTQQVRPLSSPTHEASVGSRIPLG